MNYSKNIKKATIGKRIIISWFVVAVFFTALGFGIGVIVFSDRKTEIEPEKEVLIFGTPNEKNIEDNSLEFLLKSEKFKEADVPLDRELQEFTFYLCKGYHVDYSLVLAVMQVESNFQTDVVSSAGAIGLMQINEINRDFLNEQFGKVNLYNPLDNIKCGVYILRTLFEKYKTPPKVLMAYNMGENGASRLWEQGIFEINYSKSVLQIQQEINAELERRSNND